LHVDGIEADNSRVQADISLGYALAVVVRAWRLGELGFGAIEGREEGLDVLLVCFLGCGEAGLVDAFNNH